MLNMFKRLRCLYGRHSLAQRKVRYEGHLKTGHCAYCGVALAKSDDGRWQARRRA
jgi:hypothetical protein